jgi:hypothetical protein
MAKVAKKGFVKLTNLTKITPISPRNRSSHRSRIGKFGKCLRSSISTVFTECSVSRGKLFHNGSVICSAAAKSFYQWVGGSSSNKM